MKLGSAGRHLPSVFVAALLLAMIVRVPEAPATVAEQRARLPPAAECENEVEGVWQALIYGTNTSSWYEFVLEIHLDPDDKTKLNGAILVDAYSGSPDQPEPGVCTGSRIKGKMVGHGTVTDGEVFFGGSDYEVTEVICGEQVGYNPDQFTGRIEPDIQEFQSINNDGGSAVNEPTVFRRIKCFDNQGPKKPGADVKPPPFFPKHRSSGGC